MPRVQCHDPRRFDDPADDLKFQYFSRYETIKLFILNKKRLNALDEVDMVAFAKRIIEGPTAAD